MIKQLLATAVLMTPVIANAGDADIEAKYNKSCVFCHGSGAAGAPISFNAEAWASRLEKSEEELLANVVNGYMAMPPKGMCVDCSDEEFKALITYMATPKE